MDKTMKSTEFPPMDTLRVLLFKTPRLSRCHLTPEVEWEAVAERVKGLR